MQVFFGLRLLMVVAGFLVVSCGLDSGDGRLDCAGGEVPQGTDIEVFGESEQEVVDEVLGRWTAIGASLVAFPSDESWAAVIDGRDVAVVYPERNGDGRWTVHAVRTCGDPETGQAPHDGSLDCANDAGWGQAGLIDPTIQGLWSSDEAMRQALDPFLARYGGQVVLVRDDVASLVVDEREQVVVAAMEVDAGGWVVASVSGCEGFEP